MMAGSMRNLLNSGRTTTDIHPNELRLYIRTIRPQTTAVISMLCSVPPPTTTAQDYVCTDLNGEFFL